MEELHRVGVKWIGLAGQKVVLQPVRVMPRALERFENRGAPRRSTVRIEHYDAVGQEGFSTTDVRTRDFLRDEYGYRTIGLYLEIVMGRLVPLPEQLGSLVELHQVRIAFGDHQQVTVLVDMRPPPGLETGIAPGVDDIPLHVNQDSRRSL